ncbi:MAG: Ppx/GppA phosphatase family protein [Armatimonadota bacterium]|nr:Ppx/GppA phosphatase family protein [Armatimonadota bacterium]
MRAAAIDIGTNSVLLVVGERLGNEEPRILHERAEITRLGEGVDAERQLRGAAMERTAAVVARFADEARALGASLIRAVGTSALRDANNAEEFALLLRRCAGLSLEVVHGDEEARLAYAAVRGDASLGLPTGALVVVDIGGGSVEFVFGYEEELRFRRSLDCGAVRVTERFFHADPPTPQQLAAAAAWLNEALAALPDPPNAPAGGIGGTCVNLAAVRLALPQLDPARVHGQYLHVAEVERQIALFASMPTERRRGIPGLEPKRADVILAGALVLRRVLSRLRAPGITVSARGLRYGVLYELLAAAPTS